MIIWRGFGILIIPVFGLAMILGVVVGTILKLRDAGFSVGFVLAANIFAEATPVAAPLPPTAPSS